MSLFGNLKSEGLEQSEDRLGGYSVYDTDIYDGVIKLAYAGKSDGGAQNVSLVVAFPGGKEYKETVYITNKKGENFYMSKGDSPKKVPLPGFTTMDEICLVASGKSLSEQEGEEKTVKLYDSKEKKELPTAVMVLTDLIGQKISLGIVKTLENKTVLEGTAYVPTADEINRNVIEKIFDTESHMTVPEGRAEATEAKFWDAWLEKNKGKVRDKRTFGKDGTKAGAPGKPASGGAPTAGGDAAPRKSLFGKK